MEPETNSPEVTTEKKSTNLLLPSIVIALVVLAIPLLMKNKPKTDTVAQTETPAVTSAPMVEGAASTPAVESTPATPATPVNGAIAVEAGSFYYKPNLIQVKKGQKVKLTLNSVSMMHDFNIDELGVKVPVTKSGNSATVTFTANKVGEFEFYCSVGQHRANGQVGKIIVTQ